MQYKYHEQNRHLAGIVHDLSLYQVLAVPQLFALYPDLPPDKLRILLKRLEKSGRILWDADRNLILHPCGCENIDSRIAAFWVLLDFLPSVSYHCPGEFPVVLTFHTDKDAFDVIHVQEEKEILMNRALGGIAKDAPHRLVIIDSPDQIRHICFPCITAFCLVSDDGKIQYFQRKGGTNDGQKPAGSTSEKD